MYLSLDLGANLALAFLALALKSCCSFFWRFMSFYRGCEGRDDTSLRNCRRCLGRFLAWICVLNARWFCQLRWVAFSFTSALPYLENR